VKAEGMIRNLLVSRVAV